MAEPVKNEWIDGMLFLMRSNGTSERNDDAGKMYLALEELMNRRKDDEDYWTGATGVRDYWTVKRWLQDLNEKMDDLKETLLYSLRGDSRYTTLATHDIRIVDAELLAKESCKTINTILSMLKALGIDNLPMKLEGRVNETVKEGE